MGDETNLCAVPMPFSFKDCADFYRFRCDDARIERISKTGWLSKIGTFRSKKRHFVWDGVRRQLREYKLQSDALPIYKYSFDQSTHLQASPSDEFLFHIVLGKETTIKLK